jgi:hypothetical protein
MISCMSLRKRNWMPCHEFQKKKILSKIKRSPHFAIMYMVPTGTRLWQENKNSTNNGNLDPYTHCSPAVVYNIDIFKSSMSYIWPWVLYDMWHFQILSLSIWNELPFLSIKSRGIPIIFSCHFHFQRQKRWLCTRYQITRLVITASI